MPWHIQTWESSYWWLVLITENTLELINRFVPRQHSQIFKAVVQASSFSKKMWMFPRSRKGCVCISSTFLTISLKCPHGIFFRKKKKKKAKNPCYGRNPVVAIKEKSKCTCKQTKSARCLESISSYMGRTSYIFYFVRSSCTLFQISLGLIQVCRDWKDHSDFMSLVMLLNICQLINICGDLRKVALVECRAWSGLWVYSSILFLIQH